MKVGLETSLGYFFPATGHNLKCNEGRLYKSLNVLHALECLPVIGSIAGVASVIFFTCSLFQSNSYEKRSLAIAEIGRGVLATTSLGGLVLVPLDIIATLVRIHQERQKVRLYDLF
jgi:hypothetical protein